MVDFCIMLPQWEVIGKENQRAGHTISASAAAFALSATASNRADPVFFGLRSSGDSSKCAVMRGSHL